MDELTDKSEYVLPQPVTVDFSVELHKWHSASEAQQLLLPHQNTESKPLVLSRSKISS